MEFLLGITLFGSIIGFWAVIALFIVLCIYGENTRNGYAPFGGAVAGLVAFYFYGSGIQFVEFAYGLICIHAGIYVGVGLIFAAVRTILRGVKKGRLAPDKRQYFNSDHGTLSESVSRWVLMWPISLPYWVLTDLWGDFFGIIWDNIRYLFEKLEAFGERIGQEGKSANQLDAEENE